MTLTQLSYSTPSDETIGACAVPESATQSTDQPAVPVAEMEEDVLDDVLVEEVSIDGMCGVY